MLLCSFWDPRRLNYFYIDVTYCVIIGGCNKCHCYGIILITLDVFTLCMDRGFGLVCYVRWDVFCGEYGIQCACIWTGSRVW